MFKKTIALHVEEARKKDEVHVSLLITSYCPRLRPRGKMIKVMIYT